MKITISASMALAAALFALSSATAEPVTRLPTPDGSHAVGVRRFELVDTSRHGVATDAAEQPRALPAIVWYPAEPTDTPRAPYFTAAEAEVQLPALARNMMYEPELVARLASVQTNSIENATPLRARGRFPLIIFSHGYYLFSGQNQVLAEELASHGYVVVSIGHPRDSVDVRLADGRIVQTNLDRSQDGALFTELGAILTAGTHEARVSMLERYRAVFPTSRMGASLTAWRDDTVFAANALLSGAAAPALADVMANVNSNRLALAGMSFGGATAANTCRLIARCRAAINLDGLNFNPELYNTSVERPLLLLHSDWVRYPLFMGQSTDPAFTPFDYSYERWTEAGTNRNVIRVRVKDTQHMGFTDLALLMRNERAAERFGDADAAETFESVGDVMLAFLDWRLKGGRRATIDRVIAEEDALVPHDPSQTRAWAQSRD